MSCLLAAALHYATPCGWPCFPLVRKKPLAGSHGFYDATLDPEELDRLFAVARVDGVGIATGAAKLFVVDLDGPEAARAWRDLVDLNEPTAPMPLVRSPGGPDRWHLYFAGDDPRARSTSRGVVGPMIETKAAGRYVVAPPSRHPNGGRYAWARFVYPPPPPEWLLELTKPTYVAPPAGERRELASGELTRYGQAALVGILATVRAAPHGARNDTLNRAAFRLGQLVAGGQVAENVARGELVAVAVDSYGDGERRASTIVSSGLAAGLEHPARIGERR